MSLRTSGYFATLLLLVGLMGCGAVKPKPSPALGFAPAQKLTSGSACGISLLDLIPIGLHDADRRAFGRALDGTGAKGLTTQSMTDQRFDLMIASVRCASVEGVAVY
ncbi:MAG: hypothetical protein ACREQY_20575 [Candidatus Binatia bacterium]